MTKKQIDETLSILGLDCYYENDLDSFTKHDALILINYFDLLIEPSVFVRKLLVLYNKYRSFRPTLIRTIYYYK